MAPRAVTTGLDAWALCSRVEKTAAAACTVRRRVRRSRPAERPSTGAARERDCSLVRALQPNQGALRHFFRPSARSAKVPRRAEDNGRSEDITRPRSSRRDEWLCGIAMNNANAGIPVLLK